MGLHRNTGHYDTCARGVSLKGSPTLVSDVCSMSGHRYAQQENPSAEDFPNVHLQEWSGKMPIRPPSPCLQLTPHAAATTCRAFPGSPTWSTPKIRKNSIEFHSKHSNNSCCLILLYFKKKSAVRPFCEGPDPSSVLGEF